MNPTSPVPAMTANIALFEDIGYQRLLPLTWLRAAFELLCGTRPLHARWPRVNRVFVRPDLEATTASRVAITAADDAQPWVLINGRVLAAHSAAALAAPPVGVAWKNGDTYLALGVTRGELENFSARIALDPAALSEWCSKFRVEPTPPTLKLLDHPWQPALWNADQLRRDLHHPHGGIAGHVYNGAHVVRQEHVHIAPEASVKPGAVLDAESGPIVVDRGAQIQANAVLEGPCYVGPGAIVRPGAVIREGTTIGPVCKVGGEIEASIFLGYANKQHDGFLGHSYVCPWVNLGADTVTSDLKNTYGTIRVHINGVGIESRERFVGSIIGDHAKTGIGTILPTGCVVGVAANVFTTRGVPKFVPSFSWLVEEGLSAFRLDKALEIAKIVMGRRKVELTSADTELLRHVATAAATVERAGWPAGGA